MGGWTPVAEPQTGGWTPVQEPTPSGPSGGAGGSFPEQSFTQKLFDPNYKQADPTLGGSALAGHIAQSFDIVNVAKNLRDGVVGVGEFANDLGKTLLTNPKAPPLGSHSFFENMVSGSPLDSDAWKNLGEAKNKFIDKPMQDEFQKSMELIQQGRFSEAAGHGIAGLLPGGSIVAGLAEQAGSGDVGGAVGKGLGMEVGGKAIGKVAGAPSEIYDATRDFLNRADGTESIIRSASSVHKIAQNHVNLTIQSLRNSGEAIIKDAVDADVQHGRATGVPQTISTSDSIGEANVLLSKFKNAKPDTAPLKYLNSTPARLNLSEATQLRTRLNDAAWKAKGTPDGIVLGAAINELDQNIAVRFNELGDSRAWDTYNKKYHTSYQLADNYSSILDPVSNRNDSVGRMRAWADMDTYDIQREMKNQGMTAQIADLKRTQADAVRIVNAHDILSKKMGASMYKMATAEPGVAALGIGAAVAMRPAVGIGAYLTGTVLANAVRRMKAAMEVGRIAREYPEGPMEVTSDSGPNPKSSFKPPPPTGPGGTERRVAPTTPPSGTEMRHNPFDYVEGADKTIERDPMMKAMTPRADSFTTEARAKLGDKASNVQVAQEANRMRVMNKQGMPYKESTTSKADRLQRIKKYNKE